jgi:acyl carrier protein
MCGNTMKESVSGTAKSVVYDKLLSLIAGVLKIPVEEIQDDLAMSSLDTWDSLKHMELIASLEKYFGIELTFDEIVTMRSVREIKRVLMGKGTIG